MARIQFLRLLASTRQNRFEMVHLVQQAIQHSGGWVVDFRQFSNHAGVIFFETEGCNAEALELEFLKVPVCWTEESLAEMKHLSAHRVPDSEIKGSIHLTFIHTEPDVRIEVPAVPG